MQGRFVTTRRVLITLIAGFLMLLHVVGLFDLYTGDSPFKFTTYVSLQSVLSVFIVASLTLVILGKKLGLMGMWVSITALILTQYWAHFGFYDAEFVQGRSVFSYLRGFMIPTVITALFFLPIKAKS